MGTRLRYLLRKELLQLKRDRRLRTVLIAAPIVQLLLFGYAVTLDVKHIPVAVCDRDRSAETRDILSSLDRSEHFRLRGVVESPVDIDTQIASGRALVGLHIPEDFSKRRARGETAHLQVILDGTDMNSARVADGYLRALIAHHLSTSATTPAIRPRVSHQPRIWFNPELRSVNFMVPGVICMILGTVMTAVTAMAIVREREAGTLEQLIVTPIRPVELMLGKMLPFAAIGLLDVSLVILLARYWFGVAVAGSIVLLFVLAVLFLLTTLGLGLFISTVSRTQQQAMLTAFFVLMPSVILSGVMYPIENMPRAIQLITYLIPLRYFVEIVRGIYLEGAGVFVLWPQAAALGVLGGAIFTLSGLRFRKRLG